MRLVATAATLTLQFSRPIPFGPYLSAGALLVVLFWNPWFSKFETFFSRGPLLPIVFILMATMFVPLLVFVRFIKYQLGYRDIDDDESFEDWTSGDQLMFYANNEERAIRTNLDSPIWPGIPARPGNAARRSLARLAIIWLSWMTRPTSISELQFGQPCERFCLPGVPHRTFVTVQTVSA